MAKRQKRLDNPNQQSLFELIIKHNTNHEPAPGSMDIDKAFREAVSKALKACPLSRYEVAGRMSELFGQDITKTMLDSWTAESKEQHRFPAIFLPVFCVVTGQTEPLEMLGLPAGVFVMQGPDALRADIHRDKEMVKTIQKRIRRKMMTLDTMQAREK